MTTRTVARAFFSLRFALVWIVGAASAFSQENSIQFRGFLSHGFLKSSHYNYLANSSDGDFDFSEVGVNLSWTPLKRTTINGQLFAFELGPYGNYNPDFDFLFVDYAFSKRHGIRLGRIKREQGIYNHIQDIDVSRSTIILPMGVYDPRYRDISSALDGLSFYGSFPLGNGQSLDYSLYAGLFDLENDGGVAGYALTELSRSALDPKIEALSTEHSIGGQLWYNTALQGLRAGIAVAYFPDTVTSSTGTFPDSIPNPFLAGAEFRNLSSDIDYLTATVSLEYSVDDWTFAGEFMRNKTNLDVATFAGPIPLFSGRSYRDTEAWYGSISKRFNRFEPAITYADYRDNSLPIENGPPKVPDSDFNTDLQLSLRFDATDNWTIKIERHSIEGRSLLFNQHGQNPVLDQMDWVFWAVKNTLSF